MLVMRKAKYFLYFFLSFFNLFLFTGQSYGEILKFKKAVFREVLDYLSQRYGFSYIIRYPDYSFLQEDEYKEIINGVQDNQGSGMISMGPANVMRVANPMDMAMGTTQQSQNQNQNSQNQSNKALSLGDSFEKRLITFVLNTDGMSVSDIIKVFCSVADVECRYNKKKKFLEVIPYKTAFFSYPAFLDYKISGSLTPVASSSTTTSTSTTSSSSGEGESNFYTSENYEEFVEQILKGLVSKEGRVFLSKRGYVVVVDRPSYVERIKKVWNEEVQKQTPVLLSVKVIRIDLNKKNQSGIDWTALIQNLFGNDNQLLSIGGSFAPTGQGITFSFDSAKVDYFLKVLSEYGNVKIVYDWVVKSRGGIPVVFSDIQSIPYLVQTVVQGDSGITTATEPQYVDVGLRITVLGSLEKTLSSKEKYEGQVYINISSLVNIDNLGTASDPVYVPNVKSSVITIPFTLSLGEAMVISSFKVRRHEINRKGLPFLDKLPILSYLFGYNEKSEGTSEIVVIITPDKAENNYTGKLGKVTILRKSER